MFPGKIFMNCNACAKFAKTSSCKSFLLTVLWYVILLSILACSRTCQNGGTLDAGPCTCSCASGFSGAKCESEYTIRYLCELIKLAENVLVSVCKLINVRTKLKKILHCI